MAQSAPSNTQPVSDRVKECLILLLAAAAGYVDAVGFLNLAHLFTSHMSGNSAAAGAYFGQGNWRHTLRRAYTIPIFVAGVLCGAALIEAAIARRVRSVFWQPLALEAALLVVYLLTGQDARVGSTELRYWVLPIMPCFAMGVQSATLRRVGHSSVRTTYVTGMLNDFAEGIVAYFVWRAELGRGAIISEHSTRPSRDALGRALFCGGIWLVFMIGAGFGSIANNYLRFASLILPVAGLLVVLAFDLRRPLYTKPA